MGKRGADFAHALLAVDRAAADALEHEHVGIGEVGRTITYRRHDPVLGGLV
jgi:hypothetical protein